MKIVFVAMASFVVSCVFMTTVPSVSGSYYEVQQTSRRGPWTHKTNLTVALILPKIVFGKRNYQKAVNDALSAMRKSRSPKFEFLNTLGQVQVHSEMMSLTPSPTGSTNAFLC